MQIHWEKTLEQPFSAVTPVPEDTPAWLTLCLAKSLTEWLGRPCRLSDREGDGWLQLGYEVQPVPVLEFAQTFGPLLCGVDSVWPVQVFGLADSRELIELSFVREQGRFSLRQHSLSGVWCENLQDLCLSIRLPDPLAADCMDRLLRAAVRGERVAALDWRWAAFLEQQKLAEVDHTLSFCYVALSGGPARDDPAACLAGLQPEQKEALWRMFLEKQLLPPEFEWLRDALTENSAPNWIEWHLALYRTLEQLGIRFCCSGSQFTLVDQTGSRLYFGVDHTRAAEYVLMKILFPLHQ